MGDVFQMTCARWCFELFGEEWDLATHCQEVKALGYAAIDLAPVSDWQEIFNNGLTVTCALPDMSAEFGEGTPPFGPGLCNPDRAVRRKVKTVVRASIDVANEHGVTHVIVFSGMEIEGVQPDQALENCVAQDGFPELVKYAASKNVKLVLEQLNTVEDPETWRGHPGFQGNKMDFVSRVVERTNAAVRNDVTQRSFGIALDPYHTELMGDDCAAIIERHHGVIDVLHLAGIREDPPSMRNRCEINLEGQRIDFAAIADQLAKKGKQNMPVMCEWIPQMDDPRRGLEAAAETFAA